MQTIPSLGIARPATRSPDPRPPKSDSGSSFTDYLRTISVRDRFSADDRRLPSGSTDGGSTQTDRTDFPEDAGGEKRRIAAKNEADLREAGAEERKATKDATAASEHPGARRVAKRADDVAVEQTNEVDDVHDAAKEAAVREVSDEREWAVKRESAAGILRQTGVREGESVGVDQRSGSADGGSHRDAFPRDGHAVRRGDAVGHSGDRKAVDSSGSDRGKSEAATTGKGASKNASAASAKSAGGQDDSNLADDTVSAKGAEAVAVDEDQAGKVEKEHSPEKSGAATDEQTVARIAGKNGAIRAEGANQPITRSGERDGRTRIKGDKARRHGEAAGELNRGDVKRGDVKRGENASSGDETRKRIVADLEVNLREEPDRDGALNGDKALSDKAIRQGAAAETDSSSFLTRLEHAPNTPTQRPATAEQAAGTLARRLNGDLGTNIVRQAKVMLKEADQAEIRLIIRPPELGRVRINMHMENGHIAGRILVDNGSVREAVEQNLAALQRAFEDAGLEVGDFEVSTGDSREEATDDRAAAGHRASRNGRGGVEQFADSVEPVVVNDYSHRRINLVA